MTADDPWRLLAALAENAGGELSLYAGDVDALPADVRVEIRRETVVTGSRPEGYRVIVVRIAVPRPTTGTC
jgi:hypothetical protein